MAGQWVVKTAKGERGPYGTEQLRALAAAKRISGSTFVRRVDQTHWVAAGRVEGLLESPTFPSKADGVWSSPVEGAEDTDGFRSEDDSAVLSWVGEAKADSAMECQTPPAVVSLPQPPAAKRVVGPGRNGTGGVPNGARRPWNPLRILMLSFGVVVLVLMGLDFTVRFAVTMATEASQEAVGFMGGVLAPWLADSLLFGLILALMAGPIFWLLMLIHCLRYEHRGGTEKLTWTLVIILLNLIGAVLYCLIERRQVEAERSGSLLP